MSATAFALPPRDPVLYFVQRLRGERKFSGLEELKAQIGKDIALGRTILALPEARLV